MVLSFSKVLDPIEVKLDEGLTLGIVFELAFSFIPSLVARLTWTSLIELQFTFVI